MKEKELLEEIKDTLMRDKDLTVEMKLEEIEEWDSLAIISIISLFDQLFSIIITTDDINNCKTIKDLINLTQTND
jgi:acyl carrier protein